MICRMSNERDVADLLRRFASRLGSLRSGLLSPDNMARKFVAHGSVLAAVDQDGPVGFAAFYHNDTASQTAFLSMIAVRDGAEGLGWGTALLAETEHRCSASGMERLALEVASDNGRAIAFYRRHGFVLSGAESNQGKIRMEKRLPSGME